MAVSKTRGRDLDIAPPKSDIYTGLLAVSLVAMITGCVLLYLDYSSYPQPKPPAAPAPTVTMPAPPAPAAPAQPAPASGAPATPPMN